MKLFGTITMVCLVLSSLSARAQEKKTLDPVSFNYEMGLISKKMNTELVSCRFKREVFKDIKSSEVIETTTGEIFRGKGFEYKMINPGMTTYQTTNLNIVVDSLERVVYLSDVDSSMRQITQMQQIPPDALKDYKLEKIIFSNYYILRAEPANASIGILEFYVHSKSAELYKLNIYYPPGNYFSQSLEDESTESPYLSIIFEPIQKLKDATSVISLKNVLEKNASGDYVLSDSMSGFQLKDTRYKYKPTK